MVFEALQSRTVVSKLETATVGKIFPGMKGTSCSAGEAANDPNKSSQESLQLARCDCILWQGKGWDWLLDKLENLPFHPMIHRVFVVSDCRLLGKPKSIVGVPLSHFPFQIPCTTAAHFYYWQQLCLDPPHSYTCIQFMHEENEGLHLPVIIPDATFLSGHAPGNHMVCMFMWRAPARQMSNTWSPKSKQKAHWHRGMGGMGA